MKRKNPEPVPLDWNPDIDIEIKHLVVLFAGLMRDYGGDAKLRLDAGYNNIEAELLIRPSDELENATCPRCNRRKAKVAVLDCQCMLKE